MLVSARRKRMRTLAQGPAARCLLCGGARLARVAAMLRDSTRHGVVACAACGIAQLSPLPSHADQQAFHRRDRQTTNIGRSTASDEIQRRKAWDTARRARWIAERLPAGGTVLDVGSGYGTLLSALAERGVRVTGLETSAIRRRVSAGSHQVRVLAGDVYNLPDDLGRFDAIALVHVLEHLVDPVAAATALRAHLQPNGLLFVETPNRDDLLLDGSDAYRCFYWQRAHVVYFTPAALDATLRRAGYAHVELLGIQRYGIENLMSWLVRGAPQLDAPSFETTGPYRWLERAYKAHLETSKRCDTLVAVASA